jgi:hypothetical protein
MLRMGRGGEACVLYRSTGVVRYHLPASRGPVTTLVIRSLPQHVERWRAPGSGLVADGDHDHDPPPPVPMEQRRPRRQVRNLDEAIRQWQRISHWWSLELVRLAVVSPCTAMFSAALAKSPRYLAEPDDPPGARPAMVPTEALLSMPAAGPRGFQAANNGVAPYGQSSSRASLATAASKSVSVAVP